MKISMLAQATGRAVACLVVALFVLLGVPTLALALTLEQAKVQGLVGETPTGYLESVNASASAEVSSLVADINKQRRAKYQEIAKSTKTDLKNVEILAGEKAIEKTAPGQYYRSVLGGWRRK